MPNSPQLDKTPDFYESVYERLSEAIYDILSELEGPNDGLVSVLRRRTFRPEV